MKKLLNVLMITLALNFLALIGGVAYMAKTGALTREKIAAIKAILGPATTQAAAVEKKDQPDASTQPTLKLEELLARVSGRPAGEQIEFMQRTFDSQMAQLDRREREVLGLKKEVENLRASLEVDMSATAKRQKLLDEREKALTKDAADKGFADTMALMDEMPAKGAKDILAGMNDATATKYLRAMDPGRAAKIIKEFKTPPEAERVQRIVDLIRGAEANAKANEAIKP